MERLTYRLNDQCDNPTDSIILKPYLRYEDPETRKKILNRLAAYEDSGLEPEDIKKHEAAYNECLTRTYGPFKQKISQWLQAENDGRLVVLPCGTDVELVRDGYAFKADHWSHTLTAFRDAPENKSGKQIALFSTKEAETALARKGDTHETDSV